MYYVIMDPGDAPGLRHRLVAARTRLLITAAEAEGATHPLVPRVQAARQQAACRRHGSTLRDPPAESDQQRFLWSKCPVRLFKAEIASSLEACCQRRSNLARQMNHIRHIFGIVQLHAMRPLHLE